MLSEYLLKKRNIMLGIETKPEKEKVTTIPKRSEKMKEQMKGYKKEAKLFMKENPVCQVKDCKNESDHIHHKAGRIGENLTDKNNWLAVCADHHRRIEDDPLWAKENN